MRKVTVLALIAGLALSAGPMSAVHAGSRGYGPGLVFVCYTIADPSPGQIVQYDSTLSSGQATVGPARLFCSPATGHGVCDKDFACGNVTGPLQNPAWNQDNPNGHLKCYNVRSSKGDNPQAVVNLSDIFQEETVAVGGVQFICVETSDPAAP